MNTPALPPILESKLAQFRKRVWIVKLAEGLLAAALAGGAAADKVGEVFNLARRFASLTERGWKPRLL